MTIIRRLTNSCLTVTDDGGTTLLDPGFFTFETDHIDLETIGDVQTVLITHEHGDHVKPEFVQWLADRNADLTVHANQAVVDLLAKHGITASVDAPAQATFEDGLHEMIPTGATPPNRAWTVSDTLTHPGDSYQPSRSAPVLALPLLTPWGSMTQSIAFARRLNPRQVIPIHDFYLSASGRQFATGLAGRVLAGSDIEFVPLDWGESFTV